MLTPMRVPRRWRLKALLTTSLLLLAAPAAAGEPDGWECQVAGNPNNGWKPCADMLQNICTYSFTPSAGKFNCRNTGTGAQGECKYLREETYELDVKAAKCTSETPKENWDWAQFDACSTKTGGLAEASPQLGPYKNSMTVTLSEKTSSNATLSGDGCVGWSASVTVEKGKTSASTESEEITFKNSYKKSVPGCDAYKTKVFVKAVKRVKKVPVIWRKRVGLWFPKADGTFDPLGEKICKTRIVGNAYVSEWEKVDKANEEDCSGCGDGDDHCSPVGAECKCADDAAAAAEPAAYEGSGEEGYEGSGEEGYEDPGYEMAGLEGSEDTCSDGSCSCDDGDPCTYDECDEEQDICVFTPVDCDDGDACSADSCDPASGSCTYVYADCDDGDACTMDYCDTTSGSCFNDFLSCDDGDPCTIDSCDPSFGGCTWSPDPSCDPCVVDPASCDPCLVDPASCDPCLTDPAGCDPCLVDPMMCDPWVDPPFVGPAVGCSSTPGVPAGPGAVFAFLLVGLAALRRRFKTY